MPSVQAKGTSLLLLLHSLRKCGYCSAYTAGRKGHQIGFEMAEFTGCSERAHVGSQTRPTTPQAAATQKESCIVVQACNPNAWAVQAGKITSLRSLPATQQVGGQTLNPPPPPSQGSWALCFFKSFSGITLGSLKRFTSHHK